MNETIAVVFFTLLVISLAAAAMLEFQRDRRSLRSLGRSIPLVFSIVLSALLLTDLWRPYLSFHGLSLPIAVASLLIPICALGCGYRSRVAATLIFLAGLLLAFYWYINRFAA